jgi:hypothetical protein
MQYSCYLRGTDRLLCSVLQGVPESAPESEAPAAET